VRIVIAFLAATGVLVTTVMVTPLVPWWARKLAGPTDDPAGDVLIVLGGSALEDGIIYAVRAFRQTPFAKVVVSGGGRFRPAAIMRDFLLANGVPSDRVVVEDRSTTTRENATFTKDLLIGTSGRLVLLTSDYHMWRAEWVFRKVGLNVAARPFPDLIKRSASRSERWPEFFDLCSEALKSVYYWVRGWI
jgi:uncharacterized SAM-binding protein YcdF (DUF218 family)